jgi:3-hydroxyacyl-[acyl-carrier-protein] dehydratase
MKWDIKKIKSILPHREPFLFIDEIIEIEGTKKVVAIKKIKSEESFFKGHFPHKPVMPGVLTIEAMAQTALVLYALCKPEIADTHPDYYLGKVKAEFFSPVFPGETLILEAHKVKIISQAGVVDTRARVGNRIVARANMAFGIKKNE